MTSSNKKTESPSSPKPFNFRHRALRHHAQGIFEAERVFGHVIRNSAGRTVPVRYILERHVMEDCGGVVPTVGDWLLRIEPASWMSRGYGVSDLLRQSAPERAALSMKPVRRTRS